MNRHPRQPLLTRLLLALCLLSAAVTGCSKQSTGPDHPLPSQLTTGATDSYPTWSTDGSRIAFSSQRSGSWAIWIATPADSSARQLTPDSLEAVGCSWTSDASGGRVAFASFATGLGDIWVMADSGGAATRITSDPGSEFRPAWSRDGKSIAYISSPTAASEQSALMVVSVATLIPVKLLTANTTLDTPSWYPDAKRIAVSRPTGVGAEVLIVDVSNGSHTTVPGLAPSHEACLNHTATRLAYSVHDERYPMLGLMTITGEDRILMLDCWFARSPSWSPDDKRICYYTEGPDGTRTGLFVVTL